MSTALDSFTLLFQEKVALERRQDSLETAIDWYEDRITRYSRGCKIRPWKQKQIDRIQAKLTDAQDELSFINDELTFYTNVNELARDEYNFSADTTQLGNGRTLTTVVLNIKDSLYDDTFELGDTLKVYASGTKTKTFGGRSTRTSRLNLTPVENEDGLITGFFGSTSLGDIATQYDNFMLSIRNTDNELLYSEELGVQTIA